jgi:transposase-like protein
MMSGMAIKDNSAISENADGSFAVPSQTGKDVVYTVKVIKNKFICNCPDFTYRKVETCKHGYAVKFWIATNTYLNNKPIPKVFAEDSIQCDRCGSIQVIHYGKSSGKQAYYCKDCQHKFTPSLLKKAKYSPEMVMLTLDLYFSGLSLRKVARSVNDHFNINMGSASVYRWIKKYVPIISEYVNSLVPPDSELKRWDGDEVFAKCREGNPYKNTTIGYLWNVMDHKTRFLLASKLSKDRDSKGAILAFREALKNAHGLQPNIITTDALDAYGVAIPKVVNNKAWHKARQGINKPHANNNRIERMNGTQRERIKVQRGWKKLETPIPEGLKIHYNFVRPHMSLQNRTPAQKIGVMEKKAKWLDLLELAVSTNRGETTKENNY